ncbi:MAG: cobalamin-dependent protein [Comamonadaceae bacterium]|nr:cobalamin-dependent protein [Comamonadaceae bacterium]
MTTHDELKVLSPGGLQQFWHLQPDAVAAVTTRLHDAYGSRNERTGTADLVACREDLTFHLEFLRPVLEFGLLQPMVDYLLWFASVQTARGMPAVYLTQSLDWLADFFAETMDSAEAAVVANALWAARKKFVDSINAPMVTPQAPVAWAQAAAFEAALLSGSQREALGIVNTCLDDDKSLIEVQLHVIQPALYSIGEKWQANLVSVAQEHMATAVVESVMTVALLRSPPPVPNGRRVLLACVAGNHHAIGLRMVADSFLLSGWEVEYLGANVPTPALVQQVADWKPDVVGLSVSFAQQLGTVKTVIAALTERLGAARPAVIVGGLAVNRFNHLAVAAGADASGVDALVAVDSANGILGSRSSR